VTAAVSRAAPDRRLLLASVLVGTFLGTFNNSVANVAVLDLIDDLHVDIDVAVWFITGYVLAFAVLMPAAGRLVDAFGTRRVYLIGLASFAATSLLVAVAPSFPFVIAARVAQGIVNAPVLPVVMVTLVAAFPPAERGRAMGLWASVNGAAIAIGPPVGGVLADTFGWRAIFWLDVPLALAALALAARHLPDTPARHLGPLDVIGGGLLTGGLVAVMVALSQGPRWGWSSPSVVCLLASGSVVLALASRRSRKVAAPFLDITVLRNRRYAVLAGVAALQMVVLFSVLFSVPLLLVELFGKSVGAAGAVVFALPMTMVLAGPWVGGLSHHHGARFLTAWGAALLGGAATVLAAGAHLHNLWLIVVGLVILGAGVSAVQSPTATKVADEVDDSHRGVALGLFHTIRFLAGVLGTAGAAAVFTAVTRGVAVGDLTEDVLARAFVADFALAGVVAAAALLLTRFIPPRVAAPATQLEVV
jgi:EmrB/QacA subfamily drug resistance transporter